MELALHQQEKSTCNYTHNTIQTNKTNLIFSNLELSTEINQTKKKEKDRRKLKHRNLWWFGHRLFIKEVRLLGVRFDSRTCLR